MFIIPFFPHSPSICVTPRHLWPLDPKGQQKFFGLFYILCGTLYLPLPYHSVSDPLTIPDSDLWPLGGSGTAKVGLYKVKGSCTQTSY